MSYLSADHVAAWLFSTTFLFFHPYKIRQILNWPCTPCLVACSSCLKEISSMKSPFFFLLPHAGKHQWWGSPSIRLISHRILLYICVWQACVRVPDGLSVKALNEALHMLNLGFSKSKCQVSSLSLPPSLSVSLSSGGVGEGEGGLPSAQFEVYYVTAVLVEVEQSGDYHYHTSAGLLRTGRLDFFFFFNHSIDFSWFKFQIRQPFSFYHFTESYKISSHSFWFR